MILWTDILLSCIVMGALFVVVQIITNEQREEEKEGAE